MKDKYQAEQNEILLELQKAIMNVVRVEGKIKTVTRYGNCVGVIFENGRTYKQPLISLSKDFVVEDKK